jgi:hypothetical protein
MTCSETHRKEVMKLRPIKTLVALAAAICAFAVSTPASAEHGWDPYPWRYSPMGMWDYAWYVNAMQTAKLCRYHGLVACGNKIYGDGYWFRDICQYRGISQYDAALIIENKATQAWNWWGGQGITVHWAEGGGYPPHCYFTAEWDGDVHWH